MSMRKLAVVLTAAALVGCQGGVNQGDAGDGGADARDGATADSSHDASPDAHPDAHPDAPPADTGVDAGMDSGADSGSDSGPEASTGDDAGKDASTGGDASTGDDASTGEDAGPDAADEGTDTGVVDMCPAGSDGTTCATGHCCGGACVSNTATVTCGSSCTPCVPPANATATCDGTACGFTCNAGYHDCGGACVSNTDTASCGSACAPCGAPANGTATCDGTACGFTCDTGYMASGGACVAGAVTEPRPLAPVSTGILDSLTVDFRWALASGSTGAHLDICSDRACATVVQSQDVTGSSATVTLTAPAAGASRVLYWRVFGRNGTVTGASSSPVWAFTLRGRGSAVHGSWGTVPDFNGDGLSDLVVGAPTANAVRVFNGQAGMATALVPTTATLSITDDAGTSFGASVSAAGDVNGDGYADLIVGAPGADAAYVFFGSATGFSATLTAATANATLAGTAGTHFGTSVAGAGDVNGDGYADVVVGSPDAAAAYVYYGSATGPAATASVTLSDAAGSRFGVSVATAGDVNGDGFGDVVVGAPGAARAAVFLGSTTGLSTTPGTSLAGTAGTDYGTAVATGGDVNGDGYTDVLVGSPSEGAVYVYNGAAAGLPTTNAGTLRRTATGTATWPVGFGTSVASGGDSNNDGYAEVIVGAPGATASGSLDIAYAFVGAAAGLPNTAAGSQTTYQRSFSSSYTTRIGTSVAYAGDLNGDGYDDIVVGAPGSNQAFVYPGTTGMYPYGVPAAPTISGAASSGFGTSLALAPVHRAHRALRLARRD